MSPDHPDFKVKKPRPVWERCELDTNESWPYFKAYRDTDSGVRTLERVRFSPSQDVRRPLNRQAAPTLETLHRWYREGQWASRISAYDAHLDEVQQEEREALARHGGAKLAAEQMAILQKAADVIRVEIEKLLESAGSNDFSNLKPSELVRLMDLVFKYQRLHAGQATEHVKVQATDLSKLSPDEVRQMLALQKKAEGE
jgi:hypothetical protein